MDMPESIAIKITTNAVVIAGFGASTSTSTAAVPGASAPKIGTVSTVITQYFQPVVKPTLPAAPGQGRPRKRGCRCAIVPSLPAMIADGTRPELLVPETANDPPPPPQKKARINWGKPGPFCDRMHKAIQNLCDNAKDRFDDNGKIISDHAIYARRVGIPCKTFYKYIHPDEKKHLVLGDGSRGKTKLLTNNEVKFTGEILARQDRANDGLSRKEAKDVIIDLNNNLSRSQAAKQLSRRVLPENSKAGVTKAMTQKVQSTMSNRTNISLGQQFCWHCIVDEEYNLLCASNTGLCKRSGKTFGEVMGHFIVGLNEMCLMSDGHGVLRVFGSADKKKHEKLLQDSRVFITVVRTGTVAGDTGPTIFPLKGTKERAFFTNNFL
jgi:hypothetical protein